MIILLWRFSVQLWYIYIIFTYPCWAVLCWNSSKTSASNTPTKTTLSYVSRPTVKTEALFAPNAKLLNIKITSSNLSLSPSNKYQTIYNPCHISYKPSLKSTYSMLNSTPFWVNSVETWRPSKKNSTDFLETFMTVSETIKQYVAEY